MFLLNNQRILKIKKLFKNLNLEAFLISNFYNIIYLTGFQGLSSHERESWFLITKNKSYFFTDSRYFLSSKELKNKEIIILSSEKNLLFYLQEIFKKEKVINCGFEADDLKVNELYILIKKIKNVKFIPTEKITLKQRAIKDKKEIEKIKKACQIGDECLKTIIKLIKQGVSEKELAFKIEFFIKEKGFDLAFFPLVAFDKNSSLPHYNTQNGENKKLKNKGVILIDFGVKFENYCSDITRIFFLGKPNNNLLNLYQKLLKAQEKAINFCQKERLAKEIDLFCRETLAKESPHFSSFFYSHATGHGVGLEIHELPKISINSQDKIIKDQVFTIEPGIYIPKKHGLRIEDTILIEENGAKILTQFDKKPTIL